MQLPKQLEELKNFNNWVCYKLEPRPTKEDPNHLGKVPYNPVTGYGAKANNPKTWVDYDTAVKAYESGSGNYDGIGFELGNTCYCGIDIDHCVEDGKMNDLAARIVSFIDSYTEYSISGTGLHIITKSVPLDRAGYNKPKTVDIDIEVYRPVEKKNGDFLGEIEGGRFLTISGNIYEDAQTIEDRTDKVKRLVNAYWPTSEAPAKASPPPVVSVSSETRLSREKKMLISALDSIKAYTLDFNEWSAIVSAMKACGFSADEAETWSSAGGNPKHVDGYIYKRWEKFHLPRRDDSGASGVIVNIAKRGGWNVADAFTEEERRQYGKEQHPNVTAAEKKAYAQRKEKEERAAGKRYGDFMRNRANRKRGN